jgi:hypothetical protein
MTLPSLGTASPIPLSLYPTPKLLREVVNSWSRWSPHGHSIETEWIFIENKGISCTSQNLRSEQHLCSGEGELKQFCKEQWSKFPPEHCAGLIWGYCWQRRVNQLLNPRVHIRFPPCTVNVYTVCSIKTWKHIIVCVLLDLADCLSIVVT